MTEFYDDEEEFVELELVSDQIGPTGQTPAFLSKLWEMVEKDGRDGTQLVKWTEDGAGVQVFFRETHCLEQYFKSPKIATFQRQLNMYGFKKV